MANVLTRRPPQYTGKDAYLREVSEYLENLHQTMDHLLWQMQKQIGQLAAEGKETEE